MAKFRKKPIVVEASQWFPGSDPEAEPEGITEDSGLYFLDTLEGSFQLAPGDWIITGIKGERYPCKPDIFAATYEPA